MLPPSSRFAVHAISYYFKESYYIIVYSSAHVTRVVSGVPPMCVVCCVVCTVCVARCRNCTRCEAGQSLSYLLTLRAPSLG